MPELSSEIEEKIKKIESGRVTGKKYMPEEYIKHIDKVLED
jgi:hypothetical protein